MANRHILKTLDKVIEYGWLTVVLAVPLYFNVYSQRVFEPDKVALFRSIVGIMVLAWVIKLALSKRAEARTTNQTLVVSALALSKRAEARTTNQNRDVLSLVRGVPSPLPWLVLALASVYLLTTATALSPRISFWGSYEWRQGAYTFLCYLALFFMIARNLHSEAQMTRLVTAVLYASLPISLYGVSQYLGLDPLPWQWTAIGRVFSTMGHPNFLGAYLTMVIPLTAARLLAPLSWTARTRYVLLILLQLGCLLLTFSRGSWLALTISALIFAFLLAFPRARGRFFVLVALLASLLLILATLAYLDPKGIFSYSPLEPLHSFLRGKSATARIRALTWEGATQLIAARPFLGYGPESFPLAFPRVYPPQLAVYGGLMATGEHAHNEELDLTISIGLLGTTVYLLVLIEIFRQGWRALRHVTPMTNTIIGLLSAIAAYLIQNQLSFATTAPLCLLWSFMAVIAAVGKIEPSDLHSQISNLKSQTSSRMGIRRPLRFGMVILTAFALAFILWTNVVPVVADVYARKGAAQAAKGDWKGSIEAYRRALGLCPDQDRYHRFLASSYLGRAMAGERQDESFQAAEEELLEAIRLSPSDLTYRLDLGRLYYQWGLSADPAQLGSALEAYGQAAGLSPSDPEVYVRWGLTYQALNRYEETIDRYHQALNLDQYNTLAYTYLGDAYTALGRAEEALEAYSRARWTAQIVDTLISKR